MVVSIANLTVGSDVDGGSSSTTASVSPASNNLVLLSVASRTGITTNPNQPTITGNGLTWVAIGTIIYDSTSTSRRRITIFRALGASPSAGTITIDFGGQNQTDIGWSVDQCSGIDTSGTNGSGAIVQSATNKDETGTATSLTVTLGAFGGGNNVTFGAFGISDSDVTKTAGTGFTILGDGDAGGTNGLASITEWKNSNDTSVDMSFDFGTICGGIAIELKAAVTEAIKDIIGNGVVPFAR